MYQLSRYCLFVSFLRTGVPIKQVLFVRLFVCLECRCANCMFVSFLRTGVPIKQVLFVCLFLKDRCTNQAGIVCLFVSFLRTGVPIDGGSIVYICSIYVVM